MAAKGKKSSVKAKIKKTKKVAKAPAKKKVAAKRVKKTVVKKAKVVKAKKPIKSKSKAKPAKAKIAAKPKKAIKTKARVVKKPVQSAKKKVSKPKSSAVQSATKSAPVKNNVTVITDFLKHSQKGTMSETVSKPKAKKSKSSVQVGQTSGLGMVGVRPYHEEPGEEYMNDVQREHFRRMLNQWKLELMQEVDRTVDHMQNEAANFPDLSDRATQEEEFSLELRTRDRERKLIKKIEEALVKIDQNEYGYCEGCGVEIGIRRLEARPTATLCIDCKTLDEIKERQMGG